jgi:hypothetical protein
VSADGWVGFDLDGTLAHYEEWEGPEAIGAPITAMVDKVKELLGRNVECRIVTARVAEPNMDERFKIEQAIHRWCITHIGVALPITNAKDYGMWCLYDDRAVAVEKNTGRILGGVEA